MYIFAIHKHTLYIIISTMKTIILSGTIRILIVSFFFISSNNIYSVENESILSGKGTKENPFLIETPEHLLFLASETREGRNFSDQYLRLTRDIDLSGKTCESIGSLKTAATIFSGIVDGGGYTVRNLVINEPESMYVGLFGCSMGTIENLHVENCLVEGKEYVGGLVGFAYEGTVKNCSVTGQVKGTANRVGLLLGQNDGIVVDCKTSGTTEGVDHVGGLVGLNYGSIINSSSDGHVKGTNQSGGLVGLVQKGRISNCDSKCTVEGVQENIGGLIGQNNGTIVNCMASGSVSGRAYVGGLIGWNYYGSVDNSRAVGNVKGMTIVGGLIGSSETDKPLSKIYATGTVDGVEGYAGGLIGMNNGSVSNAYATGKVSGKSYLGGLIGVSQSGNIMECNATGVVEGKEDRIGGLIGKNNESVTKCFATGAVSGKNLVGGLVGTDKENCSFSDCYSTGNVIGSGIYIGGLIGQCLGSVSNCYTSGSVSGIQYVGGLVGAIFGSLKNSLSASTSVIAISGKFAERIFGEPGENAVIENNYALESMTVNGKVQQQNTKSQEKTGISKIIQELYLQSTFQTGLGWDFNQIWSIREGETLPVFKLK